MIKNHPFQAKQRKEASWIGRIVHRKPEINAFIELNNLFAAAESIQQVTFDNIADINNKYKIDIHERFRDELLELYNSFLSFCFIDRKLSQEETKSLFHLKDLLGISDNEHKKILDEIVAGIYEKGLSQVLSDGNIDDHEKKWLEALESDLEISTEIKNRIYQTNVQSLIQNKVTTAISDQMLSEDEEKEIRELANRLGVAVKYDNNTLAQLAKYRLMWRIVFGEAPSDDINLSLKKGEVCYFQTEVGWFEIRRLTKRVQWSGPRLRFKITRGLSWNMGDYSIKAITQDNWTKIDVGQLYLTSKRLIFIGRLKNMSLDLNKIINITQAHDGVLIEKDSGRNPFIAFSVNIDIFCAYLSRAKRDLM